MAEEQNIPEEKPEAEGVRQKADSNELIPETSSDPTPSNLNLQSLKEMEVHHHGHVHEKKKWKEYLFQFLMLFLAVFCGFLAEYQLEHKIEKDRELQFIKSLVTDLHDDVKLLDEMIAFEHVGVAKLDTLMYLLNDASLAKQNGDHYIM